MKKICSHFEIQWRHVSTADNPADRASRGGEVANSDHWWNGPKWLRDPKKWPKCSEIEKSQASEAEAKVVKEQLNLAQQQSEESNEDEFDDLLKRHNLRKTLRIQAWIRRFTTNRKHKGPLTSEDLNEARNCWIERVQRRKTMRETYWIPTLRQMVKSILSGMWGMQAVQSSPDYQAISRTTAHQLYRRRNSFRGHWDLFCRSNTLRKNPRFLQFLGQVRTRLYVAGLTSFLCFVFCFALMLMLILSCENQA